MTENTEYKIIYRIITTIFKFNPLPIKNRKEGQGSFCRRITSISYLMDWFGVERLGL